MARDPFAPKIGPLTDRHVGTVKDVLHFNRHGHGPYVIKLRINANLDPDLNYPCARVSLGHASDRTRPEGAADIPPDFGGVLLTVGNLDDLIANLKDARAQLVAACPSLATEGFEVRDLS